VPPDQRSRFDLLERLTALEHRLATMARLEQAKGALMVVYGLTEDAPTRCCPGTHGPATLT